MTSVSSEPQIKAKISRHPQTKPQCQVNPNQRVAQLIDNRCMVSTLINGVPLQMLLDSGAQVTMVGKAWMERELPTVQLQPLESLFASQSLEITTVNDTEVPLEGWAEVYLQICSHNHGHLSISIPLIISKNCSCPVLDSNVIADIIKENACQEKKLMFLLFWKKL